jgi:hypothetical protein
MAKDDRPRCQHGHLSDNHPNCFRDASAESNLEREYSQNNAVITTRSPNIDTLEKALEHAEVDMKIWNVERYVANSWEVTVSKKGTDTGKPETYTNFQIKIWLKRKAPVESALDLVVKRLEHRPVKSTGKFIKPSGNVMLEISLFDAHFGKLCWEPESGDDYDLKIAEEVYRNGVSELIGKTKHYDIEKILFPIGNDFFHINSPDNKTPLHQNPLDVDSRLPKIFEAGFMAVVNAIDKCLAVAPVKMIWIPGNHDPETSYYLSCVLKAYYRGRKDVEIDNSPAARKYIQYGVNCLMFTHYPTIKQKGGLPLIMAGEEPEMWGKSLHREIHTGHYHIAREVDYFAADTFGPVRVRILPSMTGTDLWHYKHGFVKTVKAAEAYLWHKTNGYEAHFSTATVKI